jgi:chloramphenicol 3-O-phosphotransferase
MYGPPATGKLTVATELAGLTGYPLFHNHMTRDLVGGIYADTLQDHYDLVHTLRNDIFEYCAANDTNLIFSFVYDGPEDDGIVADMVKAVTAHRGQVLFVELQAPETVLLERVTNESRKQHKKLTDRRVLASLLKQAAYPSVPYKNILKIDTSETAPHEAASLIASHFDLLA